MITRQQRRQAERQANKRASLFPEQKLAKNVNKGLCSEFQKETNTLYWFKNNKRGEPKKRNNGTQSAMVGMTSVEQ